MKLLPIAAAALFAATTVWAAEPTASDATIKELMTVSKSRELVDRSIGQLDEAIALEMARSLGDRPLNPEQRKIMDDLRAKMVAAFSEAMAWDVLEPMFVAVYKESFSQAELDGMLAFYRTPTGQAVLAKMPIVMEKTSALVQERMQTVVPKINALQQEATERLDAAGAAGAPGGSEAAPAVVPPGKDGH